MLFMTPRGGSRHIHRARACATVACVLTDVRMSGVYSSDEEARL